MSSGFTQWTGQPAIGLEAGDGVAGRTHALRGDECTLRQAIARVGRRKLGKRARLLGGG